MRTLRSVTTLQGLPPDVEALSRRVGEAFRRRGWELYLVGGVVRDTLLGAPSGEDLDFATNAGPAQTRSALQETHPDAVYDVGERFGTIGAVYGGVRVEITTYRAETYAAGSRKPSVSFHDALEADLARRDFTVNAIALDPLTTEIHDPFGGASDLQAAVVRAVGEPAESDCTLILT